MTIPLINHIVGGVIDVAARTVSGSLKKEVERFLGAQPNRAQTPWVTLRDHIRATFLSANEAERLKSELEKMAQTSYETLANFNRRFRESANKAFPQPRTPDAERLVLRAYSRGIYSTALAKKLIVEGRPANLDAAFQYAEGQAAGNEMFDGLERRSRDEEEMDCSATGDSQSLAEKVLEALEGIRKSHERVVTRVAKLEASGSSQRGGGPRKINTPRAPLKWTEDGRPICYHCGKAGHKGAECFQKKAFNTNPPMKKKEN